MCALGADPRPTCIFTCALLQRVKSLLDAIFQGSEVIRDGGQM